MLDDFYKIGQVVEVRGQRVRVKVFENKNSNVFVYKGQIIKNVSVGSFVKIPKGYGCIVCKIEGEYVQEKVVSKIESIERFAKESEDLIRIIEVSIIGVLEDKGFKRGLIDIPLVFSDVYLLMSSEIKMIFQLSSKIENTIPVGNISDYKEEKLMVDATELFASHIGIFGNTGSGKSNTLAKIYTECFDRYKTTNGFSKSRFIVVDFNGEYKYAFTCDKDVYNLSTRNNEGDKIPIPVTFLEDREIWAIVCEATEKTQKPFLDRAIKLYKKIQEAQNKEIYLKAIFRNLLNGYYGHPELYAHHLDYIKAIMELLFVDIKGACIILDELQVRSQGQKIYNPENNGWGNSVQDYEKNITAPIFLTLDVEENRRKFSDYDIFEVAIRLKFIEELCTQSINEEHISPLMSRFLNRIAVLKKLFVIENKMNKIRTCSVFSLVDVNVEFKKIIPLIICKYYYQQQKEKNNGSLHIIVDEAHNILSTSSERESQVWKDYRLETFEEIIKEGRKFGVFLTIASQRPSDISETIISQLHNYFIHRLVNNEDIRAIGKAVAFIDSNSYEMIPVLPQGACIFTGVASNFPIMVQVDLLDNERRPRSSTINLVDLWRK